MYSLQKNQNNQAGVAVMTSSGGGAMAANCRAPLPQQRKMEVVEKIKNKRLTINRR